MLVAVSMMMVTCVVHSDGGCSLAEAARQPYFAYKIARTTLFGCYIATENSGREFFRNTFHRCSGNVKRKCNFISLDRLKVTQMSNVGKDKCLLAGVQLANLGKKLYRVAVSNNVQRLV